jgi:DNA-directed RNA polymerase specialized sigma24 family protein
MLFGRFGGLPDASIGERLGLSTKTIEYRLKKARGLLVALNDSSDSAA